MRTTGQIFLDWNPADFNSWVYELADDPKNKRIHSTYKDNIHNLSKAQIEYIEHYKDLPDDFMWKVYGLGERGAAKELIYTHMEVLRARGQRRRFLRLRLRLYKSFCFGQSNAL
jgi:hypothetical protein